MNCRQARTELALWVGGDLDERATGELERHVCACPQCRELRERLAEACGSLRDAGRMEAFPVDRPTTWPRLARRIEAYERRPFAPRFNGWVPAVAVASICLAIVAIVNTPPPGVVPQEVGPVPVRAVSFPRSAPSARSAPQVDVRSDLFPWDEGRSLDDDDRDWPQAPRPRVRRVPLDSLEL